MRGNIDFNVVGNLIVSLRKELNINQQKFAEELGVSKAAVCQWESGSGIKTERLYDIAKYFDITVTELINGRLECESDEIFFGRNYDLNNHPDFDCINKDNENDVERYLDKCHLILNQLFYLYKKHVASSLTAKEKIVFEKIVFNYLGCDSHYLLHNNYYGDEFRIINRTTIDYIDLIADKYKDNQAELDYELSKYLSLKIDIDSHTILEYNDKLANKYLALLNQQQKDDLLTEYMELFDSIRLTNKNVIVEDNKAIKRLVYAGAKCRYYYKESKYKKSILDEKLLKQFMGYVKEDKEYEKIQQFLLDNQEDNVFGYLKEWKKLPLSEYEFLVDEEKTNNLNYIFEYRDSDPYKYYQYILDRDAKKIA